MNARGRCTLAWWLGIGEVNGGVGDDLAEGRLVETRRFVRSCDDPTNCRELSIGYTARRTCTIGAVRHRPCVSPRWRPHRLVAARSLVMHGRDIVVSLNRPA